MSEKKWAHEPEIWDSMCKIANAMKEGRLSREEGHKHAKALTRQILKKMGYTIKDEKARDSN